MTIHPDALIGAIDTVEAAVQKLQGHFRSPALVEVANGVPMFRHEQYDDLLISQLKCVRCVSLLRAGTLLLLNELYQEVGVLCRCLSESVEDSMFLATPLGEDSRPSKAQAQLVAEFFQQEFRRSFKAAGFPNQARTRVTRRGSRRNRAYRRQSVEPLRWQGAYARAASGVFRICTWGLPTHPHSWGPAVRNSGAA